MTQESAGNNVQSKYNKTINWTHPRWLRSYLTYFSQLVCAIYCKRYMSQRYIVIFFIVLLLTLPFETLACSCKYGHQNENQSIAEAFELSDKVVVAKVAKVKLPQPDSVYAKMEQETTTFSVIETFKGSDELVVTTEIMTVCCACGLKFEVDKTYLLYLSSAGKVGIYSTSICSRTKLIDFADVDLEFLRK